MNDWISVYLLVGISVLLYICGSGFKTIFAMMMTRLHPSAAEMALFNIKAYLESDVGRQ